MDSILLEDNQHWINPTAYEHYVSRDVLQKALSFLDTKHIIALIGARRVGKSTIAKLMIKELLKTVQSKNIFFINLEKPEFIPFKNDVVYLSKIYDEYLKFMNPNLKEIIYFFIDEVQIFANWEIFVKSKYENSNIKFIITGSNSSLLTSNYATVLTGRVLKLQIYSFSFLEFLRYKNIPYQTKIEQVSNKVDISRAKDEYLKWGGYFNVMATNDEMIKKEILKNIAEDIILKDIVPRYKIKNSSAIKDLFYYVVSNATTILNYTTLAKKINIDAKSIKEYIGYFEDNFLISTLSNHHTKLTEQIKSAKKLYLSDNGFLNLGISRSFNNGIRLENMMFTILAQNNESITYIREKVEIDFFVEDSGYFQVAYEINDESTRQREFKSFEYFNQEKHLKNILITYDRNEQKDDVLVLSLEKFIFEFVNP
jgi:predicted AAA+ superfamily ATPase